MIMWVWLCHHDSVGVVISKAVLCCHVISSPFQVCYFCPVSISGSYSSSELKYTKDGRDLSLIPRLFLGERKWTWERC